MEFFRKHVDTVIILGAFASSILWMNGKFSDVEKEIYGVKTDINSVKTEIAIMKTVMVMKNIMPVELADNLQEKGKPL